MVKLKIKRANSTGAYALAPRYFKSPLSWCEYQLATMRYLDTLRATNS